MIVYLLRDRLRQGRALIANLYAAEDEPRSNFQLLHDKRHPTSTRGFAPYGRSNCFDCHCHILSDHNHERQAFEKQRNMGRLFPGSD